jgi:hypothetical protein
LNPLAGVVLASSAFAGQVWVVGPAPGQQHDLQDTIIQAQEGDVILVKAGAYESIRVLDRSVTIVAEVGATVQLQGAARVINLHAPHSIVLSGLRATAFPSIPDVQAGLNVRSSSGQVVAQDCAFSKSLTGGDCLSGAVNAEACAGLTLVRCSALASGTSNYTPGIVVKSGAFVSLDQVTATGTHGGPGSPPPAFTLDQADGKPGMPGLYYVAPSTGLPSFVHVADCLFTGGNGGNATWGASLTSFCGDGGSGGDGIHGKNPNGPLTVLGSTLIGGAKGLRYGACTSLFSPGVDGAPGDPIYGGHPLTGYSCMGQYGQPPTSYTAIAGSARSLSGPRLVRDNAQASLSFQGAPGEIVELAVSPKPTFVRDTLHGGVQHVLASQWGHLGVVPASGMLIHAFRMPDLPITEPGATYFVQARFRDVATGQYRLSNLHAVVEVDATY